MLGPRDSNHTRHIFCSTRVWMHGVPDLPRPTLDDLKGKCHEEDKCSRSRPWIWWRVRWELTWANTCGHINGKKNKMFAYKQIKSYTSCLTSYYGWWSTIWRERFISWEKKKNEAQIFVLARLIFIPTEKVFPRHENALVRVRDITEAPNLCIPCLTRSMTNWCPAARMSAAHTNTSGPLQLCLPKQIPAGPSSSACRYFE